MNKQIREQIRLHAETEYPRECCGVIILEGGIPTYIPCRNVASTPSEHFRIDKADYCRAEDRGDVLAIVHSHPDYPAIPSEADLVSCERSGVPWYIQEVQHGKGAKLNMFTPTGYQAPLIGRGFFHGTLDCLQIVLDYYKRELGIDLGEYEREDDWWNSGKDYYRDLLPRAGFYQVDSLQHSDLILMQIRSPVPNHAGIYLQDGTLKTEDCGHAQPGAMLHHLYDRLSRRDVYGGYWADVTVGYWRHKHAS